MAKVAKKSFDLGSLDAQALILGLRGGKWSSLELTQYYLGRISQQGTKAVVFVDEIGARKKACEIDRRRSQGEELGSLQGLPFTIKDAFRVANQPSTWGLLQNKFYRPRKSSELIQMLEREDGIVLGRTSVPSASFDWTCQNQIWRQCRNPLDQSRTPGGSSGGAAAALAMGLTPLEIGSDIAGSIRYPPHCCGVTGLRTSDGWLKMDDTGPEGTPYPFSGLAVAGPLGRTLGDLKLVLDIFQKYKPLPIHQETSPDGPLKIAFSPSLGKVFADADTQRQIRALAEAAKIMGANVTEACPRLEIDELYRSWCIIVGYEFANSLPGFLFTPGLKRFALDLLILRKLKGFLRTHFLAGMAASEDEYKIALRKREEARASADKFFSEYNLWILPVSAEPALPLSKCGRRVETSRGTFDYSYFLGSYLCPTAMLGTPAVTFPMGNSQGLPIGVQIHGPRFADAQLLQMVGQVWPSKPEEI